MDLLVAFCHRYVSPFAAGVCVAGTTVVGSVPLLVVVLMAAAMFGFFSLPAGGQIIRRVAGVPS